MIPSGNVVLTESVCGPLIKPVRQDSPIGVATKTKAAEPVQLAPAQEPALELALGAPLEYDREPALETALQRRGLRQQFLNWP